MKFTTSLLVLGTFVSAALSATVTDVINDAHNISTQVTTLDNAINAFPNTGGSLVNALAIHTDAVNLGAAIDKGTSDSNSAPKPISEADGQTILTIVQGFEPVILDALSAIVAKKPAFQGLPIGGIPALVKQDLINLNASTSAFAAGLINSAPADLVNKAESTKDSIDAAFTTAIAAYS